MNRRKQRDRMGKNVRMKEEERERKEGRISCLGKVGMRKHLRSH